MATIRKKKSGAIAVHDEAGAIHTVGLGDLKVVIVKDEDGSWFAQGLDIDYAAQGSSLEEVKKNFQEGFVATVHRHLLVWGNIDNLLKTAPPEVWQEFAFVPARFRYTQVSFHKIPPQIQDRVPFDSIRYLQAPSQVSA